MISASNYRHLNNHGCPFICLSGYQRGGHIIFATLPGDVLPIVRRVLKRHWELHEKCPEALGINKRVHSGLKELLVFNGCVSLMGKARQSFAVKRKRGFFFNCSGQRRVISGRGGV